MKSERGFLQRVTDAVSEANWFFVIYRATLILIILAVFACIGIGVLALRGAANTAIALLATSTPTDTPEPTPTDTPTFTPEATATPVGTPTPTPEPCVPAIEANTHIGATFCVQGNVANTYSTATGFFIDFEPAVTGFFAFSRDKTWENLIGKCVAVRGQIQEFKGRAFVEIKGGELLACQQQ